MRCTSKRCISNLCCSRAFSACWVGEVSTVLNIDKMYTAFVWLYVSWFPSQGMDWQRNLLGYFGQLFLHYWQT